jgi:hypothetical protein
MADLSLAGGIGNGLLSFANSYQKAKQQDQQNQVNQQYANIAKQRENAGLLGAGMQADEEGNVSYTPEQQQIKSEQQQQTQSNLDLQKRQADPDSDESKSGYQVRKNTLNALQKGAGDQIVPRGMSEMDYQRTVDPFVEKSIPGFSAKIKAQSSEDVANIKNQGASSQKDLKDLKDDQKSLANDPDYKSASNNVQEYGRLKTTLDQAASGNPIASNQMPILIAKFQSGLKRINPQEIAASGGSKALGARVEQAMDEMKAGTISPQNLGFIKQMVEASAKNDLQTLEDVKQRHATVRASNKNIDQDTAYQQLTGQSPKVAQGLLSGQGSAGAAAGGGPQVGSVVKGYKFLGGDPKDKNSWEKQ